MSELASQIPKVFKNDLGGDSPQTPIQGVLRSRPPKITYACDDEWYRYQNDGPTVEP